MWLGLLPFAIWGVDPSWNHLITIPACMVITFFLLGIEELGLQIEEPFSILPIEAFCDASIGAVLNDMVLAADKDRGVDKLFFSRYDTTGDGDTDALNHHLNPNPISSANLEPRQATLTFRCPNPNPNPSPQAGSIDMSEFAALCADLGRTFTDEELAATLASLDEDGDGELSYEEFKLWCAHPFKPKPNPHPNLLPYPSPNVYPHRVRRTLSPNPNRGPNPTPTPTPNQVGQRPHGRLGHAEGPQQR